MAEKVMSDILEIRQNGEESEFYIKRLDEPFPAQLYTRGELIDLLDHLLDDDELEVDKVLFTLGMGREVRL